MADPRRTTPVNETGLRIEGYPGERMESFEVYQEDGAVIIASKIKPFGGGPTVYAMQYLTPKQAKKFAKAFKRCAKLASRVPGR